MHSWGLDGSTGGSFGRDLGVSIGGALVSPWWEAWLGPWWGLGGTKREEREKEREDGVLVRGGFSCRNSNSGTKIGALHKDWCTAQG